jgi:hypothetical protein
VVDAGAGKAAALLGRGDFKEPVQPVELLLREVFEEDKLLEFGRSSAASLD